MELKICCIQNEEELRVAHAAGARFGGLVGPMPSGVGPIDDARIARIAASAPEGITPVLLTSRSDAGGIAAHVRDTGVQAVQIVRTVEAGVRRQLRALLPGLTIVQVVHVQDERSVGEAAGAALEADYLLLDSGRPQAAVEELGGTGRVHDWALSARIVEASSVPVFLAGGLRPDNVAEALDRVRPHGVDVCSGLRPDGRLDPDVVKRFLEAMGR